MQRITRVMGLFAVLGVLLVAFAGAAAASTTIATATPVPIGGSVAGAVRGAEQPAYFALDLELAQRVQVSFTTQYAGALTLRLFRPGITDATLSSRAPRNVVSVSQGTTQNTFAADWPGRWIVEVTGPAAAAFTVGTTQIAAGTPGAVTGSTSIAKSGAMVVDTQYVSSTFDPDNPTVNGARYALVEASAGDRVQVAVRSTNGKPLVAEALMPGTTDGTVAGLAPTAVVRTRGSATLSFNATIDGAWIVRALPEADANGIVKPVTFTATLMSVTPRDPATTCTDDVTDIGIVRITGCVTSGRSQVTATGPVSFSGAAFIPLNGATLRIDTRTLEVRSNGEFAVDIAGMRVLPSTNYFLLKGTKTLTVPEYTALLGLPLTGALTAVWSLENGGSFAVTGTARLTELGVEGDLSFTVSGDRGLQGLGVRVAVDYLHGTAFSGKLTYKQELMAGVLVNVWRGDVSLAFGVTKPAWLIAQEALAAVTAASAAPATDMTPLAATPDAATTPEGSVVVDAAGAPLPAALVGAAGSLEFRNGQLAFLRGAVNTKIPIGSTGMFVTQLGAALRWNPHFMMSGDGTLTLGPEVGSVSALSLKGYVGWSQAGSCPGSSVSSPNWFGGGEAMIASWFSIFKLDACYQQAETPYIVISGSSGFGAAGILTGTARFDGYILGTQAMMIEGHGELDVWGVGVDGRIVLSNAGVAACGAAYVDIFGAKRRVEVGAERRWADSSGAFAFKCPDFAPYRTVLVARAARALPTDGTPVTVPQGIDQVNLVVRGAGGTVPGVDVIGPDGSVVAQSSSSSSPSLTGAVFAPDATTGAMQIALPIVNGGTYLIRAQAGSSIASVATSLPRPDVTIRARVARRNGVRVLTYRIAGLDGRRVRFVDVGKGGAKTLRTTTQAAGAVRVPASGIARGPHRIQATVLDERGYAQPVRVVARYRG